MLVSTYESGEWYEKGMAMSAARCKHDVDVLAGGAHAVGVADVAGEDVEPLPGRVGQRVEPAPRVERVVVDEGPHVAAGVEQRLGQVAADEAIGPGDQHAFV